MPRSVSTSILLGIPAHDKVGCGEVRLVSELLLGSSRTKRDRDTGVQSKYFQTIQTLTNRTASGPANKLIQPSTLPLSHKAA